MYSNFSYLFRGKEINHMAEVDIQVIMDKDTFAGIEYVKRADERRADISLESLPEKDLREELKGTKYYGLKDVGKEKPN